MLDNVIYNVFCTHAKTDITEYRINYRGRAIPVIVAIVSS